MDISFLGINLSALLLGMGYAGLFFIIFAESGLLFGFFFPGDSLLFTAGLLASQGFFNVGILVFGCAAVAITGDSVGYAFGKRAGPRILTKEDSLFFCKNHLVRAKEFYAAHGGKTLILARFIPAIRTFAPILAGVGEMPYRTFLFYNVAGALLWAAGMPLAGFFLGAAFPSIDRYVIPVVAGIIIISFSPPILHFLRIRKK